MVAAGWSDPAVAEQAFGPIGPFRAEDVAALIGMVFLGGGSLLLLGTAGRIRCVPRCAASAT